jgi:two-component system, cell cycle response regulator
MITDTPRRILVIDDQISIHEDYQKIIRPKLIDSDDLSKVTRELFGDVPAAAGGDAWQEEFEIDSAYQGEEGICRVQEALQQGRPYSMAFVDIRMPPGMDGIETVTRIWEIDSEILIVLSSAYSDYSWEEMARRLGRTDRFLILKKPFDNLEVRQLAMALTEKWRVARTDPLTGLLNRRSFHEHFEREWKRSVRHGYPLSCAMMDLDFFKKINDLHGHQAGDTALKLFSALLREHCRAGDFPCRYGGEEFCVILLDTAEEGATVWAERVRTALAAAAFVVNGKPVQVSASFGVAQRMPNTSDPQALLGCADQALLVAKQTGRNRTVRFTALASPLAFGMAGASAMHNPFQGIVARHVMTSPVTCLRHDTTVGEAADVFVDLRVNAAPVVDADGKLTGILSEKDVMWSMLWTDSWNKPVSATMQANVVSYAEDTPMQSIFDFLCRVTIRHVVIVRDGYPTGVISRGSLLRWFINWLAAQPVALAADLSPGDASALDPARPRMTRTAELLSQMAQKLLKELSDEETEDPAIPVIESISKMQELMNNLLANSRSIHRNLVLPVKAIAPCETNQPVSN